ncbi:hypothetical protein CFC21_016893 [Triticum aestivum]|uniref:23 kDa subunit of oxygen evolving system of photosystem II n=3 Tax=Triticum TaxID=4564 RepID=A0A9R1NTL7_TRITD|nr:hypothetical protein CFC21_016893 [Triticum aestivum]VAH30715.1 unnamed protein product [Triticum turgidum subsp. durum]
MASTSCFLHQSTARLAASARPAPAVGRTQLFVCKAQKNDEAASDAAVVTSRRAALSLLAGAAAIAVKEREFPGQVLRYEDNFDATSNLSVIINPTTKKTITDYGSPEEFLSQVGFLLGQQSYGGKTDSEGGFESDAVATANVLESSAPVVDGKQYYSITVLTRTADGDEGGKHQLITATVADGKLYVCKAQAGDKRWFKGAKKFVENAAGSFSVA